MESNVDSDSEGTDAEPLPLELNVDEDPYDTEGLYEAPPDDTDEPYDLDEE